MLDKKKIAKISAVVLTVTFLALPAQADSWREKRSHNRDRYSSHHHQHRRHHIHRPYPTYGKVVVSLPMGGIDIVVQGSRYYYCDGIYYRKVLRDYVVAAPPTVYEVTSSNRTNNREDSFTINIPNSKGAYTTVVIKRSGNGFVGPQGEFYADFPKVEQLRVMYGA